MVAFTLNGQKRELALDGETPLLWALREHLQLTGTKFGCGVAGLRRLHRPHRRRAGALLHHPIVDGRGPFGHHHRRALARRQPPAAKSVGRRAGAAMRLLPVRPDHAGGGTAGPQQDADARADRRTHGRQHLPLRHLSAHHQRYPARRAGGLSHEQPISTAVDFLGTAAAGLTFALTVADGSLELIGESRRGRIRARAQSSGSPSAPTTPSPSSRRPPSLAKAPGRRCR